MSGSERLRVVYLDHVARLSGGELALLGLLRALRGEIDAHVVLGEEGPLVDRLRAEDIAVEVLPLAPRLRDVHREAVRPASLDPRALASLPPYVLRLARRLRELDPDIVHTNSLKAALYGGAAARIARVPVIWHIRDRISPDYLPAPAIRLVRLAVRRLPSAVIVNSRATLATLPKARNATVVYNPVVADPGPAGREKSDALTLGMLGRLSPWKGQHLFLEAFAEVFQGTDARAHLIGTAMFGEDDYAAGLHRQARELGIGDRVEFRGFREDVWEELAQLDILVNASLAEGFGQAVLEGLAAGLSVVATASGGPAELISDGVNGLLVPPGEVEPLAEALARLRDDPELRARLGAEAKARSRDFTPERTARQVMGVYEKTLR